MLCAHSRSSADVGSTGRGRRLRRRRGDVLRLGLGAHVPGLGRARQVLGPDLRREEFLTIARAGRAGPAGHDQATYVPQRPDPVLEADRLNDLGDGGRPLA